MKKKKKKKRGKLASSSKRSTCYTSVKDGEKCQFESRVNNTNKVFFLLYIYIYMILDVYIYMYVCITYGK